MEGVENGVKVCHVVFQLPLPNDWILFQESKAGLRIRRYSPTGPQQMAGHELQKIRSRNEREYASCTLLAHIFKTTFESRTRLHSSTSSFGWHSELPYHKT